MNNCLLHVYQQSLREHMTSLIFLTKRCALITLRFVSGGSAATWQAWHCKGKHLKPETFQPVRPNRRNQFA